MEAQPIFTTSDFMQAEAACEQLRSHGVKCGEVELPGVGLGPFLSVYRGNPAGIGHTGRWGVIVAPEDAERATEILRAWA